jgi:hypothetical protein
MTVDDLNLNEPARTAAQRLLDACPYTVFTSGRRTIEAQAHAVATNLVQAGRKWMLSVYVQSAARDACQQWVDNNPQVGTVDELAAGLTTVLSGFDDEALSHFSKHLGGNAFDVQPVSGTNGLRIKATLRQIVTELGGTFLEKEGGLVRWHAQFSGVDGPTVCG